MSNINDEKNEANQTKQNQGGKRGSSTNLSPQQLDRRFKRCVLEACYVSMVSTEIGQAHRRAVARNIVRLLAEIDAQDLAEFQEKFG